MYVEEGAGSQIIHTTSYVTSAHVGVRVRGIIKILRCTSQIVSWGMLGMLNPNPRSDVGSNLYLKILEAI